MVAFTIRPLVGVQEYLTYFTLAATAFGWDAEPEALYAHIDYVMGWPEYRPEQVRGVFSDNQFLGGCIVYERTMRVGTTGIPTACVGMVVVEPTHGKQGIATALMEDILVFSRTNGLPLVLLDGIPHFYHRWGYTDVFDTTVIQILSEAIRQLPTSSYTVRSATLDDASALVNLYHQTYGGRPGAFDRNLDRQIHQLKRPDQNNRVVAINGQGQVVGYLIHQPNDISGREVEAQDGEALSALLQYHLQSLSMPVEALRWQIPVDSTMALWLAEYLQSSSTQEISHPLAEMWTICPQTYIQSDAAWMACTVDAVQLARYLLPEWQIRWKAALAHWQGVLAFAVGDARFAFSFVDEVLMFDEGTDAMDPIIELTNQRFVQLIFCYRPVAWIADQRDSHIPESVRPVLQILCDGLPLWITWSDNF